jgi:hypothetical protein
MKTLVILETSKNKVHFYKVDKNCTIDDKRVEELGFGGCPWICGKDIDVFKHKGILL